MLVCWLVSCVGCIVVSLCYGGSSLVMDSLCAWISQYREDGSFASDLLIVKNPPFLAACVDFTREMSKGTTQWKCTQWKCTHISACLYFTFGRQCCMRAAGKRDETFASASSERHECLSTFKFECGDCSLVGELIFEGCVLHPLSSTSIQPDGFNIPPVCSHD
jgi:hypothetical protein